MARQETPRIPFAAHKDRFDVQRQLRYCLECYNDCLRIAAANNNAGNLLRKEANVEKQPQRYRLHENIVPCC